MTKAAYAIALLTLPFYPAAAEIPPGATKTHQVYDVDREGSKIGTTIVDVERRGDATQVKISTRILVKVMFVNAYRFDLDEIESWKAGQLVAFTSKTDDNGTNHSVSVTAGNGKLEIVADGKHSDAPLSLRPTSLWDKGFQGQTELFDTKDGKRLSIKSKDLGSEKITANGVSHDTHHFKISGDFERDVWFDGDTLVRLKLQGSDHSNINSDLMQIASTILGEPSGEAKGRSTSVAPPAKH